MRWRDENPIEKVAPREAYRDHSHQHSDLLGVIEEWGQPVEPAKTVETLTRKPVYRDAGNPNPVITHL